MIALSVWASASNPVGAQMSTMTTIAKIGGYCRAVDVVGNYAYIGEGTKLTVLDVSDPSSPVPVGGTLLPSRQFNDIPWGIAVSGGIAYIAKWNGSYGLTTVDVSAPASPVVLGLQQTTWCADGVDVVGNLAYIADRSGGLMIFDVSSPTTPTLLGSYAGPGCGVSVNGNLAYAAFGSSGLYVFNVTSSSAPVLLDTYNTPDYAHDVTASGSLAFVADRLSGLQIINVATPTNISRIGYYDTPGATYDVATSGSLAYLADGVSLLILDVSDPTSPTFVGSHITPGTAFDLVLSGNFAFVGDTERGFRIFDVSDPTSPTPVGAYDVPNAPVDTHVVGATAYVADTSSGFHVIDVTTPGLPNPLATDTRAASAQGVFASETKAYLAGTKGLQVFDVTSGSAPILLGEYPTTNTSYDSYVVGDRAYLAAGIDGLEILDVANPSSPTRISGYPMLYSAYGVQADGDHAYLNMGGSYLLTLDVSDPTSATFCSSYGRFERDIYLVGKTLYIASSSEFMEILSVSNPFRPTQLGVHRTGNMNSNAVHVRDGVAYIGLANETWVYGGIHVVDVRRPGTPVLLGWCTLPPYCEAIYSDGRAIYYCGINDGLWILAYTGGPLVPMGVAAGDGVSTAGIPVTWPPVAFATEYRLYRSLYSTGTKTAITDWQTTPSFFDTATPIEVDYYYWVKARNQYGESDFSAPDPGWRLGPVPPPPTSVVATDGVYADRVRVTWDATTSATGYCLYRAEFTTGTPTAITGWATFFTYDDFGAAEATTYTYWVKARNRSGESDFSLPDPGWRQAPPAAGCNVDVVGHTAGTILAVFSQSDYAYIGEGPQVTIHDVSVATAPVQLGQVILPTIVETIFVDSNTAYVTAGSSGLHIIDVSSPSTPALLSAFQTPTNAYGLHVAEGRAYVTDRSSHMYIIDVANPFTPALLGTLDMPSGNTLDVCTTGTVAYIANGFNSVRVVDVSDPSSPNVVNMMGAGLGTASGVDVSRNLLCVACGTAGFWTWNISNPAGPSFERRVATTDARDIWIDGDCAYVADWGNGLLVYRVLPPGLATFQDDYDPSGLYASRVHASGGRVMVVDAISGDRGALVIDAANPSALGFRHLFAGREAWEVHVAGGLACVADDERGLHVFDVTTPSSPLYCGTWNSPGNAYGLDRRGNHVYVADGTQGFAIVDVSTPTTPVLVNRIDTFGTAYEVAVSGDFAYVADGSYGLQTIDISNTSSLLLRGRYDTPGNAVGVWTSGNRVYVADGTSGLHVFDLADPAAPSLLGSYNTPHAAYAVVTSGTLAYVADGNTGLLILDVGNPSAPTFVGRYNTPELALDVWLSGPLAYVSDRYGGLHIIDVTNPDTPAFRGSFPAVSYQRAVCVSDDLAYAADRSAGLWVLRYTRRPVAPKAVYASDGLYTDKVLVRWNALPCASEYRLFRALSSTGTKTLLADWRSATIYEDTSTSVGTIYHYWVQARNSLGESDLSTPDTGWRRDIPPPPPTSVAASDGAFVDRIQITWDPAPSATGYRVYRALFTTGTPTLLSDWLTSTSYDDFPVDELTSYTYWVTARNIWGESDFSTPDTGWRRGYPPQPPASVSASDGDYLDKINVAWDTVSSATEYRVYRRRYASANRIAVTDWITSATFDDFAVEEATTYTYWVRSRSIWGESGYSVPDTGWRRPLPPGIPTNVWASNGTYADRVEITWDPVPTATQYQVYRADSRTGTRTAISGWLSTLKFDDFTASPGFIYYYWVKARNWGGESDFSDDDFGWRPGLPPPPPTGLQASDGSFTDQVRITWNAVSGTPEYQVSRAQTTSGTRTPISAWAGGLSFSDFTADFETTYTYWVRARTTWGVGDYSTPDTGWRRGTPPGPPSGVSASDGTFPDRVRVTWDAVTTATAYRVFRANNPGGPWTAVSDWLTTTTFDDVSAPVGPYYHYCLKARNAAGESDYSAPDMGWRALPPSTATRPAWLRYR